MPTTPTLVLPYPVLADQPNVPATIQALATAIDTVVPARITSEITAAIDAHGAATAGGVAVGGSYTTLVTGAGYETVPRWLVVPSSLNRSFGSGTLTMAAISLPGGAVIGRLATRSASPGGGVSAPTNTWFALFNASRVLLALTTDQLTAAWANDTSLTLPIATTAAGAAATFTTTYAGLYYIGILTTGTSGYLATGPALVGPLADAGVRLSGPSTTGLTTRPAFPFTAAAIGAGPANYPYALAGA